MAFITAATRSDIVELAMGMLNKAPSTTMLNTLIEKSTAGSTIQELADYIATTDAFIAEYPSTQTAKEFATEMFAKLTTGGTITAAINTAVVDLLEGMLTAGTTKAQGFVAVIDYLSNTANNTNADLGDISKSFQNRADAAEYFSITKELGGSTDAELAEAIASVTSDAATLTAANAAADTSAAAVELIAGQTFALSTGVDNVKGGGGADSILGTIDTTTVANNTYAVSDVIEGGTGADTIQVAVNNSAALTYTPALVTGVETFRIINLDAEDAIAFDLTSTSGVTTAEIQASVKGASFDNLTVGTTISATANQAATDFGFKAAELTGAEDSFDLTLNSNSAAVTVATDASGFESGSITAIGVNGTRAYVGAGADLETVTIKGTGSIGFNGGALANVTNFDASANSGGVVFDGAGDNSTITGGSGNDALTEGGGNDIMTGGAGHDTLSGGTGNDHIDGGAGNDVFALSNINEKDTIAGGDGVDVLSLGGAIAYSTTNTDDGSNISGMEVISHSGAVTQNMKALGTNAIGSVVFGADANLTLQNASTAITNVVTKAADGTLTIGLVTDGAADTITASNGGTAAQTLVLNAVDYEVVNASSTGVDGNGLTIGNALALTGVTGEAADTGKTVADLTTVNITGNKNFTLTASNAYLTALASVDASAFTGNQLTINASGSDAAMTIKAEISGQATITGGAGADTITVGSGGTNTKNSVTAGKGADTVTAGEANDTISGGDGADSITASGGNDSITTGDGADYVDAGAGNDTINTSSGTTTAGAGNDTIIGGEGNDSVTGGGAGDDHITLGSGNDEAVGGAGNDTILGGDGNDSMTGDAGNDSIDGGAGNDTITDGAGNDTILAGDGVDSITVSTGNDSIDAGAGNDTITITGLSSADTISGGTGTDSMTITNSSTATLTPKFTSIESLTVNTSTGFNLNNSEATDTTSLTSYTITSTNSGGDDDVTLTKIASGSIVTVSDDSTWDGAAEGVVDTGDLDDLTISTVSGGTLTLNINANEDQLVHAATVLDGGPGDATTDIKGASSVTIVSSNGDSNDIKNDVTALELDANETQSLSVTANAYASLDVGAITETTALTSVTWVNGAGAAESTITSITDASSLETLSLTATGTSSTIDAGAIGAEGDGKLTSVAVTAADGGKITIGAIASDQSTAATSVAFKATGAGSSVILEANASTFGTGTIGTVKLQADSNSSITWNGGSIASGKITTLDVDLADYSTFKGAVNNEDLTFAGAVGTVDLNVGHTIDYDAGDLLIVGGATTTFKLTSGFVGETLALSAENILTIDGETVADLAGVANATYTHTGADTLNWAGSSIGEDAEDAQVISANLSATAAATIAGGAGSDTLTGNAGANKLYGNAAEDSLYGNAGADLLEGGAGNDGLSGGAGVDTLDGGLGIDTITISGSPTEVDTVVVDATEASASDSAGYMPTGGEAGEAKGQDTVTGFDSTYDVLRIVATVNDYNHAEDLAVGTATGEGATGSAGYYAKNTLLVNTDDAENALFDNAVDIVLTFSDFKAAGVSQLDAENSLTVSDITASIAYNLTGSAEADTIITSGLNDTIAGGDGIDSITGGAGSDTIVFAATAALNDNDVITGFTAGASGDVLDFSAFLTSVTSANALSSGVYTAITAAKSGVADAGLTVADDDFVILKGTLADYNTATEIADLFDVSSNDNGSLSLSADAHSVLIIAANAGTDVIVAYVDNNETAGVADSEVVVVGTIGTATADTVDLLAAANFGI